MAEGPLAEDAGEVRQSLIDRGYGADVLAQAKEITDATGRVIASDYREGFDALAAAKAKYRDAPWYGEIQGEFTEDFLKYPNWVIRLVGPLHDQGTSWGTTRCRPCGRCPRRSSGSSRRGSRGAARGDAAPAARCCSAKVGRS